MAWQPLPPRTPRRAAVLAFGLALFGVIATGLIAVEWHAVAAGRGSKGGWPWAVPFAALLCLLPIVAFAATLAVAARGGLALPRARAAAISALLGALVPVALLIVKPAVQWLGLGSDLFGGLAVSQLALGLPSVAAAAWLAAMRAGPPA